MIKDAIAMIPIDEFMSIDPWYWDSNADIYYDMNIPVNEASKRNLRRKNAFKHGDIYKCDFGLNNHGRRPGIVLIINGMRPVVCLICSSNHNVNYKDYKANISIERPLKSGILDNPSHVATNRFRYISDKDVDLLEKIGEAQPENLKDITDLFIKINSDPDERDRNLKASLESLITIEGFDALIDDISEM